MDSTLKSEATSDVKAWSTRTFSFIAGAITLFLLVIWFLIPWEWSPVDDAQQVLAIQNEIQASGLIQGTVSRFVQLAQDDPQWGLFRPGYWLFQSVVYQLPITAAHVLRLLMAIAAILGPIIYFRRAGVKSQTLWFILFLLIASGATLYQGLFLTSLQELSGTALIGFGLMTNRSWLRMILWLGAALFKSPFSWMLIGYSIYLWRKNRKREATVSALLGVGTLAISAIVSRMGDYTTRYNLNLLDLGMYENFSRLIEPMNALLLLGIVWWLVATNGSIKRRPDWIMFLIGWAGYTLQMIPWGVTAYYMGPISYLFGIFIASTIVNNHKLNRIQFLIALAMPIFVALWLTRITFNLGFEINSVMLESRQCLASLRGSNTVMAGQLIYVTSSPEGPIRIMGALMLEDPTWEGSVTLEDSESSGFFNPETTHYLMVGDAEIPTGRTVTPVCEGSAVTLYTLS
jgi:hypothetical protein